MIHEHAAHGGDLCKDGGDGCCAACGVSLGDPCPTCNGVGYHREGCKESDADLSPRPCDDCGRPIFYDDATDKWRHKTEPERGCFLIGPQ